MPNVYATHPLDPEAENVQVEFTITSYGSSASWDDPGDPPEWEITAVYEDAGDGADILPKLTGDQMAVLDDVVGETGDFTPSDPYDD